VKGIHFDGPYPNPVTGGVAKIDVTVPGTSTIEMDVFTTAFRKISSNTTMVYGGAGTTTTLQWDLKDKMGNPIADGLYYVRVHVTGVQQSVKIFKVLVLR
jgi:hypothetical protein